MRSLQKLTTILPLFTCLLYAGCSSDNADTRSIVPDAGADAPTSDGALSPDAGEEAALANEGGSVDDGSTGEASAPDALDPDGAPSTLTETTLTLALSLAVTANPDAGSADAGSADAGAEDAPSSVATLKITARDGVTPVVTDLWLYTLEAAGQVPLTGFTSTASRKTPRLMLPATIGGQPSGLAPADNGNLNGLMTNATRGTLQQGAFVSSVTGTVTVTLPAVPTSPILVVAGVEDQRYAGAAVIAPDGTPGTVPAGVGVPETHVRRSFTRDVVPILHTQCASCHFAGGVLDAPLYLVTGTREDLVNDNFALKEQTEDCEAANPDGGVALAQCVQAITGAQFLVEPGAPALSDLLQRSRPDEEAGASALGLAWFGSRGSRYSADYGDRRMPSTTYDADGGALGNLPTAFDMNPAEYQVLYDWVAQGALP